jgi:hypothetical protein
VTGSFRASIKPAVGTRCANDGRIRDGSTRNAHSSAPRHNWLSPESCPIVFSTSVTGVAQRSTFAHCFTTAIFCCYKTPVTSGSIRRTAPMILSVNRINRNMKSRTLSQDGGAIKQKTSAASCAAAGKVGAVCTLPRLRSRPFVFSS